MIARGTWGTRDVVHEEREALQATLPVMEKHIIKHEHMQMHKILL